MPYASPRTDMTTDDISLKLDISSRTVQFHFDSIRSKLGAANRQEAIALGVQTGHRSGRVAHASQEPGHLYKTTGIVLTAVNPHFQSTPRVTATHSILFRGIRLRNSKAE